MSGEVAQQRQVLERVRNYLMELLQQDSRLSSESGYPPIAPSASPYGSQSQTFGASEFPADMTPYEMMQSILREVSYLRSNMAAPTLNQASQSPLNQPQLTAELLQVLMSRLQENLSQQIVQTLESLRNQSSPYTTPSLLPGGMPPVPTNPQYDQLQVLRSRSDQMLVNLDSTLNVVFESLQRNIQAYQEALSQGLERMYNTGQQSEYTFKLLIDQLIQQVRQEASSYLLSSQAPAPTSQDTTAALFQAEAVAAPPIATPPTPNPPAQPPTSPPFNPDISSSFPYAGAELLSSDISGTDVTTPATLDDSLTATNTQAATPLDSAIEAWLQSVSAMQQGATPPPATENPDLLPLDLSDLDLGEIELPSTVAATSSPSPNQTLPIAPKAIDLPTSTIDPAGSLTSAPLSTERSDEEDTAEIDAALKLLEELSAEIETSTNSIALEDAEAQLEQMLSDSELATDQSPPISVSGDAQDELDEFYQSLFGAEQAPAISAAPVADPETSEIAESVLQPPSEADESEAAPMYLDLPADLFGEIDLSSATNTTNAIAPIAPLPAIPDPDEVGTLSDLFQGVPVEATHSVPVEPPAVQGMTAVPAPPAPPSQELFLSDDLFGPDSGFTSSDDQFTRAAPDEVLLPDEGQAQARINLEFDELTLSSLSEDLSGLEGNLEPVPSRPEFTLDDFAADVSSEQEPASSTPPAPTPFYQASAAIDNLSIEGFSTLFGEPPTSPPPLPINPSEPLPFTLEGTNTLFEAIPTATPDHEPDSSPFTLEGMDDLFSDALPQERTASPSTPTVSASELPAPIADAVPAAPVPEPFTLEGMDDLFGDAPAVKSIEPSQPVPTPISEIPPFKPELFNPVDVVEPAPPFKLEQLDNLFVDSLTPTTASPPSAESATAAPTTPDKESLDAAFESLLGTPPASANKIPSASVQVQKKKTY
jgi:hypothetical protein